MKTVTVRASRGYDVHIGPGLLGRAGELSRERLKGNAAAIVTDDKVGPLYLERLKACLNASGFRIVTFIIPNGERSKNAGNYIKLLNALADARLTRNDAVFALGGGVVGDLAGFAAATYLRGVRFVQIPTTLLAAVDSSVGGKTAIDLDTGKNLAGSFYQPDMVICDTTLMRSLDPGIFRDGLAEVIKYGVIADRLLFDMLKSPIKPQLEEIVARCVSIKSDFVSADEFDNGPRKLLNFGHTVGHAVETLSGYTVTHGSAVASGMAVITRAAEKMGICSVQVSREITDLIGSSGLPTGAVFTAHELAQAALSDKKREGDTIFLILPEKIGKCVLHKTKVDDLEWIIGLGLDTGGDVQWM